MNEEIPTSDINEGSRKIKKRRLERNTSVEDKLVATGLEVLRNVQEHSAQTPDRFEKFEAFVASELRNLPEYLRNCTIKKVTNLLQKWLRLLREDVCTTAGNFSMFLLPLAYSFPHPHHHPLVFLDVPTYKSLVAGTVELFELTHTQMQQ